MAQQQLNTFYQRLLSQWGKAHGLRSITEITCRNLSLSFATERAWLVIAYKARWKILVEMNSNGIFFQYPPSEVSDQDELPFFQISKAVRQRQLTIEPESDHFRLWLPLERRSMIIGCIVVDLPDNEQCRQLRGEDFQPLASLVASELDAFILNASIQDEHAGRRSAERELEISLTEQQHLQQQLQALHDISFDMWRTNSLKELLFTAIDQAKQKLHVDRMAIFLINGDNKIQGTFGTDIHGNTVDESYFESDIPDLWFTHQSLITKGEYLAIEQDTPLYHDLKQVGFGWSAFVSLWDEDTPIGWIACDNLLSGMPVQSYHRQILKQFGFIVSQQYVRRQAEEQLRQLNTELEQRVAERTEALQIANKNLKMMSSQDALTKVANRRVFDERFIDEWRRAERHQMPISLLIIDVDHFKRYNDHYGHAAGDQCLFDIAQALSTLERRAGTLFARYGGEEFVLLMPGQDKHAAQYTAKRALHTIRSLELPRTDGADSAPNIVTISIGGYTVIPSTYTTPRQFFQQADEALYAAKDQGRNDFVIKG
ncbi:diguanylate cyclase [Photobacterium aquae]|uniref:diguanylate cyclase n=1 Tax=Photobacterium aquae TaxID=1195763 RepID=A0A0J1GW33_9GAMM|nr:diguanylate cyclase [Photobacterium aquae]KLV03895.1 diguanylate cyclase [Photobacterium aquae]